MFTFFKRLLLTVISCLVIGALVIFGWLWQASAPLPDAPFPATGKAYLAEYDHANEPALALLASLREQHLLPSLSAAVAVNGELVWAGAVGYRDINSNTPANTDSRYRIGSISKSLTAALMMRLQDEGKLAIDEPLGTYTGELAPWTQVTLRQLASHQGGVRHYRDGAAMLAENFHNTRYPDTRSALVFIDQQEPLFAPGSQFLYSTYGYTLLTYAMERATNTDFARLLDNHLIKPLALTHTALDDEQDQNPDKATPYLLLGEHNYRAPKVDLSYKYAGGGISSRPIDVVTFGNSVLAGDWLSDEARAQLWQLARLNNGETNSNHYTLGFRLEDSVLGPRLSHGGMSVGGYSYLAIFRDHATVVAFATNATPDDRPLRREEIAEQLATIFSKKSPTFPSDQ